MAPPLLSLSLALLTVATSILRNNLNHQAIETSEPLLQSTYDIIVVGAGSAGSVVAGRLAEDGKTRVLLLEAGPPSDTVTDIPSWAATGSLFNSQFDWNYTHTPQVVGRSYRNGVIPCNRGHVIGGTGSFNALLYNRGNRKDYDTWAEKFGAKGWSYEEVLPFFMKTEKNLDPNMVRNGFHGTNGPLQVSTSPVIPPLVKMHQENMNNLGIPSTDINGPSQYGTMVMQSTIDSQGRRSSSSNAFIDPNPNPHNLHILPNSLVTKVIIKDKVAVGVQFMRKHQIYSVFATKEVILAGGTIGSAQVLMLSGIGPKEHLEKLNIPVVKDLPTGDNYQDHPGIAFLALVKPKYYNLLVTKGQFNVQQLYDFFVNKRGPLTDHTFSITYYNTKSNKEKDWPNTAIETALYLFGTNLSDIRAFSWENQHEWDVFNSQFLGRYYLFVHPVVERVRSRGSLRLRSSNPFVYPAIDAGFYRDPQDFEDMVEIIKFAHFVYEQSPISEFLEPIAPVPGCKPCPETKFLGECDSYVRCFLIETGYSDYHPVGTCRMGDPRRPDTVVDPRLKVKGIDNLRVCDASIMPLLPNANTNAGSFMIGEKCAHMVREDNGL